jgi:hypothetical protein
LGPWEAEKSEKKSTVASDAARSDIWYPAALRVMKLEGTGDGAQKHRLIDGRLF